MNKNILKIISLFSFVFLFFKKTLATCPLCVIALAGGIELARIFKIDDIITGIWIGGLTVALIIWTIDILNKKNINFKAKNLLITLSWYVLIFLSLNWIKIYSKPLFQNNPYLNKINLGILIGSISLWFSYELHNFLKQKNNGKSYFPFQKVILPVFVLLILSLILNFII
jgi:hypothetical protein